MQFFRQVRGVKRADKGKKNKWKKPAIAGIWYSCYNTGSRYLFTGGK